MRKSKNEPRSKNRSDVDITRIKWLVYRLLHEKYSIQWSIPDNIQYFPRDEVEGAIRTGFYSALDAVFEALNGDGGDQLQKILNSHAVFISLKDRVGYLKYLN